MRPVLAAIRDQQTVLNGIQTTAAQVTAQHRHAFGQLRAVAQRQAGELTELRQQNHQLAIGLRAIARAAGIEQHVAEQMFRTADVQNPAQPIPEPPAQPAPFTTVDAETPEAMGNVQTPGMVGGSTQDVAADATSTVYTPGQDVDAPALKNLVDVTAPVAGTQGPQPLSDVRTETDVRVGNPMNPQVGFPLRGPFQNGQKLNTAASVGSAANPIREDGGSSRTMAALRLARLRIATGTAQSRNDIEVATSIERDASLSDEAIDHEIATLDQVRTAAARRQPQGNPGARALVPRTAAVQRTVPSMQGAAPIQHTGSLSPMTTDAEVADADLFD